jgi:predicted metal-dependent phosphoesterase TrpH
MKTADLHVHSTFSDGEWTPEKLVLSARRAGLFAFALTDHDTVSGIPSALAFGAMHGIEILPGVEVSAYDDGVDLHILGYGIDPSNSALGIALTQAQGAREVRAARMVERLEELGAPVRLEDVMARAGEGAVGRPHVAQVLVDAGHVRNLREAFEIYLGDGKPACVEKARLTARDAVALLHGAGGVAVAAHPATYGGIPYLEELVDAGIDGVEVMHALHDPNAERDLIEFTRAHDLLMTGGSDFHGPRASCPELGAVRVPYEWVERLHERLHARRRRANGAG